MLATADCTIGAERGSAAQASVEAAQGCAVSRGMLIISRGTAAVDGEILRVEVLGNIGGDEYRLEYPFDVNGPRLAITRE